MKARLDYRTISIALATAAFITLSGCAAASVSSSQQLPPGSVESQTSSGVQTSSPASRKNESACSWDSPAGKQTYDRYSFWQLHGAPMLWYNDSFTPDTFAEVAQQADVIVQGRIKAADPGVRFDPEKYDQVDPKTRFTVAGSDGEEYVLLFNRATSPDCVLRTHELPEQDYLFFLKRDSSSGDLSCSSENYCVIGAAPDGAPGAQLMNQSDKGDGGVQAWPDTTELTGITALAKYALTNHE